MAGSTEAGLCEGRVAIVTGAGRGIGREYAQLLAKEGAKVVVNDLATGADNPGQELVDEIRAAGGEAVANHDDVSDFEGARRLIDQAIATFGKLDVLINNAGILRDRMLVNMSEQEWDAVIKVHLKGTFAPTRHAVAYWRDRFKSENAPVHGRIINTVSASGLYGNLGQTNYGAAKMGIASFTIIAARELKRYGVTVNAVAPIAITRLTANLRERSEEELARMDPKWVAPPIVWLASVEAADITGRVFEAGGGIIAVSESWHRGPVGETVADAADAGPIIRDLVKRARLNADIRGADTEE